MINEENIQVAGLLWKSMIKNAGLKPALFYQTISKRIGRSLMKR